VLCEHTFVTTPGHPYAVFQRALKNGNLWVAEAEAREMRHVSLEDALKLVHLYAEKESPKFEPAAMKWLRRYLDERRPS
jgi:predicted metal-dependent HD superfamily phosphohydrolase